MRGPFLFMPLHENFGSFSTSNLHFSESSPPFCTYASHSEFLSDAFILLYIGDLLILIYFLYRLFPVEFHASPLQKTITCYKREINLIGYGRVGNA